MTDYADSGRKYWAEYAARFGVLTGVAPPWTAPRVHESHISGMG